MDSIYVLVLCEFLQALTSAKSHTRDVHQPFKFLQPRTHHRSPSLSHRKTSEPRDPINTENEYQELAKMNHVYMKT